MKNNKGITLIALVITIIVLLILAAVSIAMLTGENSILKNATKAGDDTKLANGKEAAVVKMQEIMADYYQKKYAPTATSQLSDASQTLGAYIIANFPATGDGFTFNSSTKTISITGTNVTGTVSDATGSEGKIQWTN